MNPLRTAAAVVVVTLIASGLSTSAGATDSVRSTAGHEHDHPSLLRDGNIQMSYFEGEDGFPTRRNGNGQKLSGGRAVAHHAGGIKITSESVTRRSPDGRFFRLGINGWEPTIGVDDKGRVFYQARNADLAPQVVRSTNSGDTWKIVSPTIGGVPAQPVSLDPVLYLDKDTGRVFTNNIPPDISCQPISFSDDAGESWTTTGICGHFDHQNIFTGPAPKDGDQPTGYKNVVYYCAINLVMLAGTSTATTCGRSLDGGMTWLPSGQPAYLTPVPPQEGQEEPWCDGAVGHGYVGPNGTVYLPRVWCGQPYVSISKDEGFSWKPIQVAGNGGRGHEAGVAADAAGNVYYTWIAGDGLPYMSISRNGGKSWGKPMMIGTPGLKQARLPAMDIGSTGKIAMTYVGTEDTGKTKNLEWHAYVTMTADALAKDPVFYTGTINAKNDPVQRGSCGTTRCHTLGDFFDVTIGPDGTPWVAFVDACFKKDYCVPTFENIGVRGEAIVGRMVGGPKLR